MGTKSGEIAITKEAVVISEARDDGDLGEIVNGGDGEKW